MKNRTLEPRNIKQSSKLWNQETSNIFETIVFWKQETLKSRNFGTRNHLGTEKHHESSKTWNFGTGNQRTENHLGIEKHQESSKNIKNLFKIWNFGTEKHQESSKQ